MLNKGERIIDGRSRNARSQMARGRIKDKGRSRYENMGGRCEDDKRMTPTMATSAGGDG